MKKSLIALGLMAISASTVAVAADWSYEGHGAPHNWAELSPEFSLCGSGVNQSPIDISSTLEGELSPLVLNYTSTTNTIVNNGHTIQANFAANSVLTLEGKNFELKQVHFHAPSENTIDGKHFPLEAHFVHANNDGQLAVIGLMFNQGASNAGIAKLTADFPQIKGQPQGVNAPITALNILPPNTDYYRFNGSLTTPPCSEGVRWMVLKQAQTVSAEQLEAFTKLYPKSNRPVQAINARMILE